MKNTIKTFKEINEFFETTGFEKRTDIPDFFIFKFDELPKDKSLKMSPYQKDFYQISLILDAKDTSVNINEQTNETLENTLYFLSPSHIFSWQRSIKTTGFNVYFKAEFLNFYSGDFKTEFSLFDLAHKNFLKLSNNETKELIYDFEKLYNEFYTPNSYRIQIIQSFLLSILFKCKSIEEANNNTSKKLSKKEELVFKFQNLVGNSYIKHKKVADYADALNVSANSLNQTVKSITGKTAKEIISVKIIQEAKRQLKYTTDDISEIAYSMGFDEPTHFVRFFKKSTGTTPNEYRKA
ncbi:helix-turn-helix domain-containing protein [Flammeovirga sp. SubArs3]|uniref:helix-turn-helix domain-containing protein n=1 Tax=Flammeovirga sp. SubArs3 TaxID=2995316 RepID=UPI00248C129E|nr:helix-turn-helix domain-containing protein [Flammeovirga sp. SubArs3]